MRALPVLASHPPAKATIYKAVSSARHAGSQLCDGRREGGGRQSGREGRRLDQSGALMENRSKAESSIEHHQVAVPTHACGDSRFAEGFPFLRYLHCAHFTPGGQDRASHVTAGETEAQRGEALCTKSHSKLVTERVQGGRGLRHGFWELCWPDESPSPSSDVAQRPLGQDPPGILPSLSKGIPRSPLGQTLPRTPKSTHKTLCQLAVI